MKKEIKALEKYFSNKPEVSFAFLFGSQAENIAGGISDWDIGAYFKPQGSGVVEWEETERRYPQEDKIWNDLIDIVKTDNVDFVVLNRAPANIAASAIRGIPLLMNDRGLFLDFMLLTLRQAEDFYHFVDDYYAIAQRSTSLTPGDRDKLERIIYFLEEEMKLYGYFSSFTIEDYRDIHKRHEVERWVENIVNAAIDTGEIILASQKKRMPNYYKDVFIELGLLSEFKLMKVEKFAEWVKLRNILAHEYLDIKWQRINSFVQESQPHFQEFLASAKKALT